MSKNNEESIIEVKDLSKSFGDHEVLRKIDFEVKKGEVICILGSSGSGKSTLLRCVNKLETQTSGQVLYHGKEIRNVQKEINEFRSRVGMVFQSFNLFNNMTVLENCMEGARKVLHVSKEEAFDRAIKHLKEVGMAPYINARPEQLSGGQKQRVAIARALINRPKVLLLDEPLGALDLKLRKQMQIELKRLQRKLGITFVYVTHDQEEALTMSDRIAIINQGVLEQVDTAFDIYEHPKTRFVAGFIGESNIFDAVVISQDGDTVTVGTEVGKAQASGFTGELAAGTAVSVSVRPENMLYSRERVEGFHIKGVVKEHIYVGNLIKTIVLLNDGTEVKINRFSMDDLPKEGEMIYLYWHLEKGIVLPEKNLVDTDASRDIEGGDEDEEE